MAELTVLLGESIADTQAALNQQFHGDPNTNFQGTDDLQGAVVSAKKLDGSELKVVAVDLPAGSGNSFPMYEWDIGDTVYITYQTSHSVMLDSAIDDHIHCCASADPTGKKVAFEIKVVYAGVGSKFATPTGSPFSTEHTFTADWSLGNFLIEMFETTVGMNPTVSSIIKISVERVAPSADTLVGTADLYLDFHDAHVKFDQSVGSRQEVIK